MIRVVVALLFIGLLRSQTPGSDVLGSIRGTVTSTTGEPLRKAAVVLRSTSGLSKQPVGRGVPTPVQPGTAGSGWSFTTDASGTFAFDQLTAGNYMLSVQRNGYVRSESGRQSGTVWSGNISLAPGQHVNGLSVKLSRQGVITGKVVDEDGDPLAHTPVQLMRERWVQGKRQILPLHGSTTNDLGEYRLSGLTPGRYYLLANSAQQPGRRLQKVGTQADFGYVPTYYPGTSEVSQATPLTISAGQELPGVDFQLRKVAVFRIQGKVLDVSGAPAQNVSVMAAPEGTTFGARGGVGVDRNGVFEFPALPPGNYTLVASGGGRGQARRFARRPVQLGTRDLEGVVISLEPAFEVSGTIRVPEGMTVTNARVIADPIETGSPFGGGGAGMVKDGSWKIENLVPGKYRFFLSQIPEGAYQKSVSVQGQDISAGAMVSSAATGVELTLSADAPQLNGTVVDREGEPVRGATVVLAPDESRREQYWLFRTATVDQNGGFAMKGIAPGSYTAYAFSDLEEGSWQSPEFVHQYGSKGVRLKLDEKAQEKAALTLMQP